MLEFLLGDAIPILVGIVVAAGAALMNGFVQRRRGRSEGEQRVIDEMKKLDRKQAEEMQNALEAGRRDGDAAKRLREQGRLRD